VKVFLEDES